jgi:hypothetical protein
LRRSLRILDAVAEQRAVHLEAVAVDVTANQRLRAGGRAQALVEQREDIAVREHHPDKVGKQLESHREPPLP